MYRDELRTQIYTLTPTEIKRKNSSTPVTSQFYAYLESLGCKDENGIYHIPTSWVTIPNQKSDSPLWDALNFSPHQSFFRLKKASRFHKEPFACGNFIAIRYVYSGKTTIHTPDTSFELHENDVLLMNSKFVLSQYLENEEDLVFTMIFEKEYLIRNALKNLKGNSILTRFILDYIMDNKNPQNYILFHGGKNERIRTTMEDMLCEFIDPCEYGDSLIETYFKTLLIEMLRCDFEYDKSAKSRQTIKLAEILDYIDHNYDNISLDILAEKFGYNSKYLSRLIKSHTGKNFKDFIFEKRMARCALLLTDTELPIHQVMEQCGLTNETYFYKQFRQAFGMTPNEYRRTQKQDLLST